MFRNLDAEMVRNNISNKEMAESTGLCYKAFLMKKAGKTEFTYSQLKAIQLRIPGDLSLEYLFQQDEGERPAS